MTSSPSAELFVELERALLAELGQTPQLLSRMYKCALEAATGRGLLTEITHWLQLVEGLHVGQAEPIHEPMAEWLRENHLAPVGSRKALVRRLADQARTWSEDTDSESVQLLLPAGIQVMLLAFLPGPRVFRGVDGFSNLLPHSHHTQTIQSIKVPFGHGTVSRMFTELAEKPNTSVSFCSDAALDPVGRVATQDYSCGNRCVVGFPLFASPKLTGRLDNCAGFCFLTHPLPGVLEPLKASISGLRGAFGAYLAAHCRDWVLGEFSADLEAYGAVANRGNWIQLLLPETDPAGFQAIVDSTMHARPLFGVSDSALLHSLSVNLSQTSSVNDWAGEWSHKVVAAIEAGLDGSPLVVPSGIWAPVSPPAGLRADRQRLLGLLGAPEGEVETLDLAFPIVVGGEVEAVLCLNSHQGSQRDLSEASVRLRSKWRDASRHLAAIRLFLRKVLKASEAGDIVVLKRVSDAWYRVTASVLRRLAADWSGGESNREPLAPDFSVEAHALSGLASDAGLDFNPEDIYKADEAIQAIRDVIASELPGCSLATFWSLSWLPRLEAIEGVDEEISKLLRERPDELRRLAYEKAGDDRPDNELGSITPVWSSKPRKQLQLMAAAGISWRLSERIFLKQLNSKESESLLKEAFEVIQPGVTWKTLDARGDSGGSGGLRCLAAPRTPSSPYTKFAEAQLRTRLRERHEAAVLAQVNSARSSAAMISHELAQVSGFLTPWIASSQERIFQAARSYIDLWAVPKRGTAASYPRDAARFARESGATKYFQEVFAFAADAAALQIAGDDIKTAPPADPTENLKSYEFHRRRISCRLSEGSTKFTLAEFLDDRSSVFPDRKLVFLLTQPIAAAIVNAISKCVLCRSNGDSFYPLFVDISCSRILILNPYYPSSTTKEEKANGTRTVLEAGCEYLTRSDIPAEYIFREAQPAEAKHASGEFPEILQPVTWWSSGLQFSSSKRSPIREPK